MVRSSHLIGYICIILCISPLAILGILVSSFGIFYKIAFEKKIDLFGIFIFLTPLIALKSFTDLNLEDDLFNFVTSDFRGWLAPYVTLTNSFILGPVNISTGLLAGMGVFVRLFLEKVNNFEAPLIYALWIIALILASIGLFWSYTQGYESPYGLTAGVRSILAIGALLLPILASKDDIEKDLAKIIKLSLLLYFSGLFCGHWFFITIAFPAIVLFNKFHIFWKLLSIVIIFDLLFISFLETSFTMIFIFIASFLFLIFFQKKRKVVKAQNIISVNKFILLFIILFPILFVLTLTQINLFLIGYEDTNLYFKLFEDREPIWNAAISQIVNSNFFWVPAGRELIIQRELGPTIVWTSGAHNIFLTLGQFNGLFTSIIVLIIFIYLTQKYLSNLQVRCNKFIINSSYVLLAVYATFGTSGQSLLYDGVGLMFWLLFGQLIRIDYNVRTNN